MWEIVRCHVKFDNKLTFEKRITDICRKANRKIHELARIAPYMDLSKRRIVMNDFFSSKFNYIVHWSGCATIRSVFHGTEILSYLGPVI